MAVIETWLRQDLVSLVSVQNLSGHIFTQDNQGNRIGVEVTKNGVPVELSGTCTGYVIRSDGKTVVMYGEIDGNKASILLPAACYAVVGNVNIVLKVGETTLLACTGYVYRTTTDTIVDPGTVVPDITELLDKIDEMEQGTAAAVAAAEAIEDMTVEAEDGGAVDAVITDVDGHKHIAFTIPSANSKAPAILKSVSGDIVTFDDGADGVPLKECVVQINPVQTGTGDPSPQNIRPLFGSAGCTIHVSGKNLVKLTESMVSPRPWDTTKNALRVDLPAGTFTGRFTSDTVHSYVYAYLYDRSGTVQLTEDAIKFSTTVANGWNTRTFSLPDGGRLYIFHGSTNTQWSFANLIAKNFQLELGITMSASYIPYTGQTYPVSWQTAAGTVYGGNLTVHQDGTGTLAVNRAYHALVIDVTWYQSGSGSSVYYGQNNSTISDTTWSGILCNAMPTRKIDSSTTDWGIGMVTTSGGTKRIVVRPPADAEVSNVNALKEWLTGITTTIGGDIMISYPVAPTTYELTAAEVGQIILQSGEQNIWADTGAISLTYPADTQTYIDRAVSNVEKAGNEQIAPVEDTTTATRDYQAGDLFILNDILYKATALIVTGDTIYPGINAVETTVEDLIDEVVADIDGIIDDTAGDGDTDKTWSADKLSDIESDVEELEESASEIKGKIDGKAPVITQTASGDIVTVTDGADGMPLKECVVQIDPVQDLHEQSNPYPAGGGKNLFDKNMSGWTMNYYLDDSGAEVSGSSWKITDYIPVNGTEFTIQKVGGTAPSICLYDDAKNFLAGQSYGTSGATSLTSVTVSSETTAKYVRFSVYSSHDLNVIQLEAGNTATDYAPYENVCPITGWTGANVYGTGRNIYDYLTAVSGSYYSLTDGVVSIARSYGTGGTTMPSFVLYAIGGQTVTLSADVRMSKDGNDDRNVVRLGFKASAVTGAFSPSYDVTLSAYDTWERISYTFTLGDYAELRVGIQPRFDGHTLQFKNVQVEFGSVANDYTPYTGTAYPISWQTAAGTVYKGTVDPVSGELTVTMAGMVIDGTVNKASGLYQYSQESEWTNLRGLYGVVIADLPNDIPYNAGTQKCSHFLWRNYSGRKSSLPDQLYFSASSRTVAWASSTYTTLEEFNAYLVAQNTAGTPVTLVYPLPAPLTYQLDPVQIKTLMGYNEIWADTGVISVTYPADTQTYIDNDSNEAWAQINTLTNEVSVATPQIDFPEEVSVASVNNRTIRMVKNTVLQTSAGTANTTYRYCVFCKDRAISNTTSISTALESVESTDFFTLPQTNGVYRIKLYVALRTYDKAPHTPPRFYVCYPDTDSIKYVRIDTLETGPDGLDGMYCVDLPAGTEKFVLGVTSRHSLCTFTAIYNVEYVPNADSNIETVSGATPIIIGESGKRYVCGTVDSISITPPSTGIIDVIFTSGTTAAVLTIPNTVKFPAWFDPTNLDTSTIYEINIQDGVYGAVMTWPI